MIDHDEEIEYLLLTRPHPQCLEALDRLRAMGDRATEYLLMMLRDPNEERRGRAACRLGELGSVAALDALVSVATSDESPSVRGAARYALSLRGEPALPFALALLASAEATDRRDAALMLHDLALPESVDALARATRDPHWEVRGEAAIALGAMKGVVPAQEAIVAASHDDDPRVREYAVSALVEVGGPAASARLRELLHDPVAAVRAEVRELAGPDALADSEQAPGSPEGVNDA